LLVVVVLVPAGLKQAGKLVLTLNLHQLFHLVAVVER
jgi:hypothetical protein